MKATNLTNQNPGGCRQKLIEKLPLSAPYVIQIFPIYGCNFKCNYCGVFDKKEKDRFFISNEKVMDFEFFKKCIKDMKEFPTSIKTLRFVGVGEPLLHPRILSMLQYAHSMDVANTVEVITNGSLLTKEISDKIIGFDCVDRLIISVQGLDTDIYKRMSNAKKFNFDKLVENIRYFYQNKIDTHVYIKIADVALKGKKDENKFYKIFGDICDSIGIEHIVDIHKGTNIKIKKKDITQFGAKAKDMRICPLPFYFMEIRPDGNVIPCYNFEPPTKSYNAKLLSLKEILDGNIFKNRMIIHGKNNIPICKECTMSQYRYHEEDDLDSYTKELKEIYK